MDRSPPLQPVILVNSPDAFAEKAVSATYSTTSTGNTQLGKSTDANNNDFIYLTSITWSLLGAAVGTTGTLVEIQVTQFGDRKKVYWAHVITNQRNSNSIVFNVPIKIDIGSANVRIIVSGEVPTSLDFTFWGYQM